MRTLLATLIVLGLASAGGTANAIEVDDTAPRRLSHLLGYVAADYPNAVRDGRILDRFEHEEQLSLLDASMQLASELALSEQLAELRALREAVEKRAAVSDVQPWARRLRREVIGRAGLTLAPPQPPDLAHGRAIYVQHCMKCHGASGRADTEEAERLKPRPVSFTDPTVVEALSPLRVADTVRFGIDGTAMVPFDFLDPRSRWDVAFYVVSMRHTPRVSPHTPRFALAELAIRTDGEILDELYEAGSNARELLTFVAELRAQPRSLPAGRAALLVRARELLATADEQLARGDRNAALARATEAHGSAIAARPVVALLNPELARELDERFAAFRARIRSDRDEALHRDVLVLSTTITRAQLAIARFGAAPPLVNEPGLGGVPQAQSIPPTLAQAAPLLVGGTWRALMWPSLACLLVLCLGRARTLRRTLIAAAVATVVGAWAATTTISITTLLGMAALALCIATLVVWRHQHRDRAMLVVGAAAGAIIGFETTVLAREALVHVSGTAALIGVGGAVTALALIVFEGAHLVRRLPTPAQTNLLWLAAALVASTMAGTGVSTLQATGWAPNHVVAFVGLPALGVHPTIEACVAQLMVAAAAIRARGAAAREAAPPA